MFERTKDMKKISKLICLVLVISMIFATFSVVFAEVETPALTINIINLEEPVPDAVPSFNYDATFAKDLGISVNSFDIYEWLEVDEMERQVLYGILLLNLHIMRTIQ